MKQFENIFDKFLENGGWNLVRYEDESWGIVNINNPAEIVPNRFQYAHEILDTLHQYVYDDIIVGIQQELDKQGVDYSECYGWDDYLQYREICPAIPYNFDVLEMVCWHEDLELDLNDCSYECACDNKPTTKQFRCIVHFEGAVEYVVSAEDMDEAMELAEHLFENDDTIDFANAIADSSCCDCFEKKEND